MKTLTILFAIVILFSSNFLLAQEEDFKKFYEDQKKSWSQYEAQLSKDFNSFSEEQKMNWNIFEKQIEKDFYDFYKNLENYDSDNNLDRRCQILKTNDQIVVKNVPGLLYSASVIRIALYKGEWYFINTTIDTDISIYLKNAHCVLTIKRAKILDASRY